MIRAQGQTPQQTVLHVLPESVQAVLTVQDLKQVEELRLRAGCRSALVQNGKSRFLEGSVIGVQQIAETLMRLCNHSVYAVQEQMKHGYITMAGGVRVGLSGLVLSRDGHIDNVKEISGLNFRIPREVIGCADKLLPHVLRGAQVRNTVLVSPPACGKTTLLRDLVRSLSVRGFKVCVIDERDEICGIQNGYPAYDIGENTDVLRLCPKESGIELAIRALSPQVLVTDELWGDSQLQAMQRAAGCGCAVITTQHGNRRTASGDGLFDVCVTLGMQNGPGTVEEVLERA